MVACGVVCSQQTAVVSQWVTLAVPDSGSQSVFGSAVLSPGMATHWKQQMPFTEGEQSLRRKDAKLKSLKGISHIPNVRLTIKIRSVAENFRRRLSVFNVSFKSPDF